MNDNELNILLLEDVESDAILIERELAKAGVRFRARRVETREGFLEALRTELPDVILADFTLPQFSALEALAELKQAEADVPLILVTGSHSEEVAVQCLKEGAEDYILKSSLRRLPTALKNSLKKRAAEREIRKLAAFALFNPNPVLEFSADGTLTYFNAAAEEMARSIGKTHVQAMLPLTTPTVVKMCLSSGQKKLHLDTSVGGRVLSWSFFPVVTHNVVHCYAEDITESLNLEAQLRQVQKMESVGQLAAGVAHDFNNILTIVQGHAGLMLTDPELKGTLVDSTKQISLAAERAANLTRQLLMFSRKQIMQSRLLDLNEVITNLSKMIRCLVGEQIAVKRRNARDLPAIYADPGMMEQILVNLAVNARDAMPNGGTLSIETSTVEIDDGYVQRHPDASEGFHVCMSVSDTGHGMDEATAKRIFEPFFTTKEVGKGTGLGLATVYGIVKQHHGWIDVQSEVGKGTTFRAYFRISSQARRQAGTTGPIEVPGGSETILLVEDEPSLRELVEEILSKKGYRVLSAPTGAQAMKVWGEHKGEVDLLLTDMMMPGGVSGRALAENLQAERGNLKVVYSSGYSIDAVNDPSAGSATSVFLQKPYQPDTLAQTIRDCLDG